MTTSNALSTNESLTLQIMEEGRDEHTPLHVTANGYKTTNSPSSTAKISTPVFEEKIPSPSLTWFNACLYVFSGCLQPLLMILCRNAGLADSSSQLYMLFYYLGPAAVLLRLWWYGIPWPSSKTVAKGAGIAFFDIFAQTLNYTGASLAGPTIFAIVYSSVTVWTAVFSQLLLGRTLSLWQWGSVLVVFGGLTLTATDSLQLGQKIVHGLILVLLGSMMHALTYVMSEFIMTVGDSKLSVQQNCAVQGIVATVSFGIWQLVYTLPRWDEKIGQPMNDAGTTAWDALKILGLFAATNFVHALTFFHTLRHYPGGATSAGIMKALQAVLVFVATHLVYCGRIGGEEMCFSKGKFSSLVTVTGGVLAYGYATSMMRRSNYASPADGN